MTRILLIDDDPVSTRLLGFLLRRAAYDVTTAASGTKGIALASAVLFDLILTELTMSVLSGIDVVRALRRVPGYAATPILVVSSSITSVREAEVLDAGGTACFERSVADQNARLLNAVGALIRNT